MKRSKALLVTLGMTAGLLALAIGLRWQYAPMAAETWRKQLDTVGDDRAEILLGQVAQLGEPGIPVLVEALGSPRETVARAGRQILGEQLRRWQRFPAAESARKQAALAGALAGRVNQFGPTARSDAADLATQILRWLPTSKEIDRSRVIASCEDVLRATKLGSGSPEENAPAARPEQVLRRTTEGKDLKQLQMALADLSPLPGGSLRPEGTAQQTEALRLADGRSQRPRRLFPPSSVEPNNPLRQPNQRPSDPEEIAAMTESPAPSDLHEPEPTPIRTLPPSDPGDALRLLPSGKLSGESIDDLMWWLRSNDESTVARAETELALRGFQGVHLELARNLFDPDPEVRKALVRLLPSLRSVDATPWMLRLSRDANAEVRLAAITLMATTGDPALLQQVAEIARRDPDPRIRSRGERIARLERERTY